jgi:hypothetical protein
MISLKKTITDWMKERRSEIMMAQGLLPFQYKVENSESGLTS